MEVEAPAPKAAPPPPRGRVRSPRDLLGGLCLVALAIFVLATGGGLDGGTLRNMGPGMLPRAVAVLILVCGIALSAFALLRDGPALGRWPLRGPFFICVAVLAFSLTIRSVGLALAGPLVVIVGGLASDESRPKELVVFAVIMTIVCIVLFRFVLGLPIPVLRVAGFYV